MAVNNVNSLSPSVHLEFKVQNWQQAYDDCFLLYEMIRDVNYQPEIIVGIARGGWIPARFLTSFMIYIFSLRILSSLINFRNSQVNFRFPSH
jgi:hypothetical protein